MTAYEVFTMSLDSAAAAVEADRIDAFHELLSTLAGALDLHEGLHQLGDIVGRIVAHDEGQLVLLNQETGTYERYCKPGTPGALELGDDKPPEGPAVPSVFLGEPDRSRGFQAGLRVPVVVDGQPNGVLVLLSRRPDAYSERELNLATRIVEYLAVVLSRDRLASRVRRAALERDRSSNLESSLELLRTISEVLDIRGVFPRVSEIVTRVIPHDHLQLVFRDQAGHVVLEARSNEAFPDYHRATVTTVLGREEGFSIVGDLTKEPSPVAEPADLYDRIIVAGFRSVLSVHASARDQQMTLVFSSKRANAFSRDQLPVARLLADYIALAVSHEQLAEAERRMAEAHAREERLEARVKSLAAELDLKSGLGRAIGVSAEWKEVLKKATQVAETDTTVLLQGESGTGKEVVARFIHRASPRKEGPFVAINCAALPDQLLESELFGHERGAFTGAAQAKPGQIELASGGVLFLDEVSEMSPSAQAKFLRVLQEREFQRLGGTRVLKAQVRVIAATNRDLRKAVEGGEFREDLYYRLQVFEIRIPPLRDRKSDLLPLAEAFLLDIARSFARPPAGLTQDAKEALLAHRWPGNVRELRNALERAAILCEGGLITAQHLSLDPAQPAAPTATTDLNTGERQTIEQVMRETRGNKAEAARRLGITRIQLYTRLRKHGLDVPAGS